MTSPCPLANETRIGRGSTSIVPPVDYWTYLAGVVPHNQFDQLKQLKQLSDARLNEFALSALPPPGNTAVELLDQVAADGWLDRKQRRSCPKCSYELNREEADQVTCPNCGEAYIQYGGVSTETVYVRNLAPGRIVDWVVAIHGMNTSGAWQEAFSWYLGTTWGRSVPVAVYKYGIIIAGVIMAWRRRTLEGNLRDKLAALRAEACAQGFSGKPDVIAHSFGTWLFGHLLKHELTRDAEERLRFGRIILTGCVLRPDFDWKSIKEARLVEEVLNHYGSKDSVVPLAHVTIWDSGPSGRRGFDGDQVINLRAEGYGHSDLFSIEKCIENGKPLQKYTGAVGETRLLEYSYKRYWRPFLTLPSHELDGLPDRADPETPWRQLPWPLRGTVFPFIVLPFILSLLALLLARVGTSLWEARAVAITIAKISGAGLALMLTIIVITWLWRR